MSYCRNNGKDSDVYVIGTQDEDNKVVWECCGCCQTPIPEGGFSSSFICSTRGEMITHLLAHRNLGDKVPQEAIDRLNREIDEQV